MLSVNVIVNIMVNIQVCAVYCVHARTTYLNLNLNMRVNRSTRIRMDLHDRFVCIAQLCYLLEMRSRTAVVSNVQREQVTLTSRISCLWVSVC